MLTSPATTSRAWVRRVLGVGAALAVLAVCLIGFGLFPQEPVRRLAEARLREAVGPGSRVGGLRVVPFLLRAEVQDLHLEGPGYTLTVPRARVILARRALRGALAVRSIEAEGPTLHLTPGDPVDTPAQAAEAGFPPFEIEVVAIRDASVRWSDPETGELVLEELTVEGAIGSGALAIDAPRGRWRGERALEMGPARARVAIARNLDVTLESFEARLGESSFTARGVLARRGAPALGIDLGAQVDLDEGGPALGLPELSGALGVTGRLEGPLDRLEVTLEARGGARWDAWPIEDLNLRLEAQPDARRVAARLDGSFLGGRLEGEAWLDGEATSGRLGARGLDPAHLPAEMRPPFRVTDAQVELEWEGRLDGPLDLDLLVRGRGRHEAGTGRLEARAQGSVRLPDGAADLAWTAALRGETSTADVVELGLNARGRLRGTWPPEVTGEVSGLVNAAEGLPGDQMALAGTFRAEGPDLKAELDASGPLDFAVELEIRGESIQALSVVAEQVDLAGLGPEASGLARVHLDASGPLESPKLSGSVSVAALAWDGAPWGDSKLAPRGRSSRWRCARRCRISGSEPRGRSSGESRRGCSARWSWSRRRWPGWPRSGGCPSRSAAI